MRWPLLFLALFLVACDGARDTGWPLDASPEHEHFAVFIAPQRNSEPFRAVVEREDAADSFILRSSNTDSRPFPYDPDDSRIFVAPMQLGRGARYVGEPHEYTAERQPLPIMRDQLFELDLNTSEWAKAVDVPSQVLTFRTGEVTSPPCLIEVGESDPTSYRTVVVLGGLALGVRTRPTHAVFEFDLSVTRLEPVLRSDLTGTGLFPGGGKTWRPTPTSPNAYV